MLAYLANTVIFILVGIVITEQAAVVFTKKDLLDIFVLYIGANFIRSELRLKKENHLTIPWSLQQTLLLSTDLWLVVGPPILPRTK